jgi:hypothetical protein
MVCIVVVDNQAVQQNTTFVHHQERSSPSLQLKRSDHCNCGQQWEYGSATDCPGERAPWTIVLLRIMLLEMLTLRSCSHGHRCEVVAIRRRRIRAKGFRCDTFDPVSRALELYSKL